MTNKVYRWLLRVRPAFVASFLKKLLGIRRRVVQTVHGRFFIDPLTYFGDVLVTEDSYEPQMINALKRILKPGDTFLDVGANEGFFSVVASKLVGETGHVICVEPQSRLQEVIRRNIDENGCQNIELHQVAISDHAGTARLYLSPDMNTGSSGIFRQTRYENRTEVVPQTTLGNMLKSLGVTRIKLMKIDVEGLEYEVILGSRDVFAARVIENIALELHPDVLEHRGKSASEIWTFLLENGYAEDRGYSSTMLSKNCD